MKILFNENKKGLVYSCGTCNKTILCVSRTAAPNFMLKTEAHYDDYLEHIEVLKFARNHSCYQKELQVNKRQRSASNKKRLEKEREKAERLRQKEEAQYKKNEDFILSNRPNKALLTVEDLVTRLQEYEKDALICVSDGRNRNIFLTEIGIKGDDGFPTYTNDPHWCEKLVFLKFFIWTHNAIERCLP